MFLDGIFPWVKQLDAVLVTPEYRLAPEYQHPTHLNDCWAAFEWFSKNMEKLGIDSQRAIIAGHSAGAGLVVYLLYILEKLLTLVVRLPE
jgi:acetyl esterase/lipase